MKFKNIFSKDFFKKFNAVDIIITAIIVVALVAMAYRVVSGTVTDEVTYNISFVCEGYPADIVGRVKSGMICADGDFGTHFGEVINVKEIELSSTQPKEYKAAEVTATLKGTPAEYGVLSEDTLYLEGKKLNIVVGDCTFPVYVERIERKNE